MKVQNIDVVRDQTVNALAAIREGKTEIADKLLQDVINQIDDDTVSQIDQRKKFLEYHAMDQELQAVSAEINVIGSMIEHADGDDVLQEGLRELCSTVSRKLSYMAVGHLSSDRI